jgi:hypothetical protein
MIRIRTLGVVLATVLAVSAAVASSAFAVEHTFEFSKFPGELEGEQTGSQVFKFPDGTVTCTEDKLKGLIEGLIFKHINLTAEYSKCTTTFFGGTVRSITSFEYEFSAEGSLKLLKGATITTGAGSGPVCTITIPAQGPLTSVEYKNLSGNTIVEAKAKVTKLKSSASASSELICKKYTNDETGELTGNNLILERGGSISWT